LLGRQLSAAASAHQRFGASKKRDSESSLVAEAAMAVRQSIGASINANLCAVASPPKTVWRGHSQSATLAVNKKHFDRL
jgi:hypothetical protein